MSVRTISFTLNGQPVSTVIEPHRNLVELLQRFDLFGARESCGQGLCGCCTVLVDGLPVSSCCYLAADAHGKAVTTIEGLASARSHPVQQAWVEFDVPQCGYCQSGQIMSASALLAKTPKPSDADIDAAMAGNICRCGTYQRIRAAIHRAAEIGAGS